MKSLWNAFRIFIFMTLLTGVGYPFLLTGIAQLIMKERADGDVLSHHGKKIGAKLIAQKFERDTYFWPRPSAVDYNPLPSGGSNLGPTSAALKKVVNERRDKIAKAHLVALDKVPSELLFASGSGLDPHISLSTAQWQIDRIITARGLNPTVGRQDVEKLIDRLLIHRCFGFLGEPCVNVLMLNQALDSLNLSSVEQNE